jgi:DinB family protein
MTQHTDVSAPADRAAQIEAANEELIAFIETCTDEEWAITCAAEGWPVAVVAHHVAWGHHVAAGWIRTIVAGQEIPGSPELHDAGNAAKAAEATGMTRDEVIALARRNIAELTEIVRSLTDADLGKESAFGPAGGRPMSVDRLAGARGHLDRHLGSIRAAVGRQ